MIGKTAAVIGATGMTGNYLVDLLLKDDYFSTVRLIVRRPMDRTNPKMEVKLVDFKDAESLKLAMEGVNTVFCCIGTTQKKVKGNRDLYREIDLEIPLKAARFAREAGCTQFIIITALGANSKSRNFYLRLKGEVEDLLKATGLPTIHVLRPSMLLGDRKEHRSGERFIQGLMKVLSFAIPASYKAIDGNCVAKAMLALSKQTKIGFYIHENKDIRNLCAIKVE